MSRKVSFMYKLFHSTFQDCIKNKSIDLSTVDLLITDLPYGSTRCKWDTPVDLTEMWDLLSAVRDNVPLLFFAQTPFDKVLGASNLKMLRYEWIWEKSAATGHFNAKKMPMKSHENILVFYKKLPYYNPVMTHGHTRKVARKSVNLNSEIYNSNTSETFYDSTSRYPRSVLKFPSDKQLLNYHHTQKPVELLSYLVKTYSREGDTVVDLTMGSGSLGVACVKNNRHFIGCDNGFSDKPGFEGVSWADVAKHRINTET